MPRYRVSLGDSDEGPVGFCFTIEAETKMEAVKKAKLEMSNADTLMGHTLANFFSANVLDPVFYLNPQYVSEEDIENIED